MIPVLDSLEQAGLWRDEAQAPGRPAPDDDQPNPMPLVARPDARVIQLREMAAGRGGLRLVLRPAEHSPEGHQGADDAAAPARATGEAKLATPDCKVEIIVAARDQAEASWRRHRRRGAAH